MSPANGRPRPPPRSRSLPWCRGVVASVRRRPRRGIRWSGIRWSGIRWSWSGGGHCSCFRSWARRGSPGASPARPSVCRVSASLLGWLGVGRDRHGQVGTRGRRNRSGERRPAPAIVSTDGAGDGSRRGGPAHRAGGSARPRLALRAGSWRLAGSSRVRVERGGPWLWRGGLSTALDSPPWKEGRRRGPTDRLFPAVGLRTPGLGPAAGSRARTSAGSGERRNWAGGCDRTVVRGGDDPVAAGGLPLPNVSGPSDGDRLVHRLAGRPLASRVARRRGGGRRRGARCRGAASGRSGLGDAAVGSDCGGRATEEPSVCRREWSAEPGEGSRILGVAATCRPEARRCPWCPAGEGVRRERSECRPVRPGVS